MMPTHHQHQRRDVGAAGSTREETRMSASKLK
jgi:hypothetical protein